MSLSQLFLSYGIYTESWRFQSLLVIPFYTSSKKALPLLSEDRGRAAMHAFSYII
jgi:hypothetical protein